MKNDIIECLNCGKKFVDTTKQTDKLTEAGNTYQWTGQDSREKNSKGKQKFSNMCPFCYGTNTRNTHEETKAKAKFISKVTHSGGGKKNTKRVRKPNLNTEYIVDEVLGVRQECDIAEDKREYTNTERTLPQAESQSDSKYHVQTSIINFVEKTGGTFDTSPIKSFTPIELMEHKLEAQHRLRLSPSDNREKYKEWRYGYTRNYNKRLRR